MDYTHPDFTPSVFAEDKENPLVNPNIFYIYLTENMNKKVVQLLKA
jgi:hypothetical protein